MKHTILLIVLLVAGVTALPQVVNSFDAPDTGISGLAYAEGSLYAVSSVSKTVYQMDPFLGDVLSSFTVSPTGPNGLGYAGSLLYVTNGTSNVYKYDLAGTAQGTTSLYCSG